MNMRNVEQATVWLTVEQSAARAQTGTRTIYLAVKRHELRAARVSGRKQLRIKPEWVDAWLESSAEPVELQP